MEVKMITTLLKTRQNAQHYFSIESTFVLTQTYSYFIYNRFHIILFKIGLGTVKVYCHKYITIYLFIFITYLINV